MEVAGPPLFPCGGQKEEAFPAGFPEEMRDVHLGGQDGSGLSPVEVQDGHLLEHGRKSPFSGDQDDPPAVVGPFCGCHIERALGQPAYLAAFKIQKEQVIVTIVDVSFAVEPKWDPPDDFHICVTFLLHRADKDDVFSVGGPLGRSDLAGERGEESCLPAGLHRQIPQPRFPIWGLAYKQEPPTIGGPAWLGHIPSKGQAMGIGGSL